MKVGETKHEETTSDVLGLTRKNFIESVDKINLGLAPKGLVALVNTYKSVNYAIEHFSGDEEICQRAIEYRTELEYTFRMEAYRGYKKYHKRLGLLNGETKDVFKICDDHLELALKPLPEKCKKSFEKD